ncbi:hypothetical protein ACYCFK_16545 [Stutzerimonas stutzeri]
MTGKPPRITSLSAGHLQLIDLLAELAVEEWLARHAESVDEATHARRNLRPLQQRQAERIIHR